MRQTPFTFTVSKSFYDCIGKQIDAVERGMFGGFLKWFEEPDFTWNE